MCPEPESARPAQERPAKLMQCALVRFGCGATPIDPKFYLETSDLSGEDGNLPDLSGRLRKGIFFEDAGCRVPTSTIA
jgi:hypothetical protein